ncbi:hypothetical protein AA15669_0517 [Saccharibacter floricola DSM 15669]|uniref:Uncharacterized protein n=1 Tax=Saccharibacter floricola DSM 15669 TaxID=1123227 RepID=A0ABQ0NXC9_9PROT|nr:hypothetical protein AA15669_0517 [Saccharibacter floricola DSM 15669]
MRPFEMKGERARFITSKRHTPAKERFNSRGAGLRDRSHDRFITKTSTCAECIACMILRGIIRPNGRSHSALGELGGGALTVGVRREQHAWLFEVERHRQAR